VLLASASYRPGANVTEYAAEFVPAFESLQGDFAPIHPGTAQYPLPVRWHIESAAIRFPWQKQSSD
jgi:hypothetical protein